MSHVCNISSFKIWIWRHCHLRLCFVTCVYELYFYCWKRLLYRCTTFECVVWFSRSSHHSLSFRRRIRCSQNMWIAKTLDLDFWHLFWISAEWNIRREYTMETSIWKKSDIDDAFWSFEGCVCKFFHKCFSSVIRICLTIEYRWINVSIYGD